MKLFNVFLKAMLAFLLVHAVVFSDLPQYKNKAIALRVVFYPLAAALTYIVWRIANKRKSSQHRSAYPFVIDVCITFVVAFDLWGNTMALYDTITWWDDVMHLLLSVPWVVVAGYWLRDKRLSPKIVAGLVIAYGSTSHIVWELLEYLSFVRSNPTESLNAYQDTMGDLVMSTIGTLIGSFISYRLVQSYQASHHVISSSEEEK